MEQAINKLQDSVAILTENMVLSAENMAIGFQKNEYNFRLLDQKVDDNFELLNRRIDLLQGKSACTMKSLEKAINDEKPELQKVSVVIRYENEYFCLVNSRNGLPD